MERHGRGFPAYCAEAREFDRSFLFNRKGSSVRVARIAELVSVGGTPPALPSSKQN